jgi:DNA-binding NtrC family response regulator
MKTAFSSMQQALPRTRDDTPPPVDAGRAIDDEGTPNANLSITLPIGSSLYDIERAFIVATLDHFNGDKRRAASALGCSVKTLYNKLHLYRRQLGHVAAVS